jgi:DNA-binding response OmpR family regulator
MGSFDPERTVLVVDADINVRDMVCLTLSRQGCFIQSAKDVETAYHIVKNDPPDTVLLDLHLPALDLVLFNEYYRRQNPLGKLILMSSRDSVLIRAHILSGIKDFLAKPFDDSGLIRAVGSCAA